MELYLLPNDINNALNKNSPMLLYHTAEFRLEEVFEF